MSRERYLVAAILILVSAGFLRTAWLRADPPTGSVGIVWHDEGAWTHNARNRALWGAWRTDDWNPVFIAPVFTALEYAAFETFGVGTWQARTVPVASGLMAIAALMIGLSALWGARDPAIGRRAAVIGGLVLAFDFTWTMWNRAALMESTMTAFVVCGWAAYALAERRPLWGAIAGVAAVLAWFTKASAAFFIAALVAEALWVIVNDRFAGLRNRLRVAPPEATSVRAAWMTLAGLAAAGGVILAAFVLPHWSEYQFYNWQMSVERKPAYGSGNFIDRASWLPIVQDFFARMWVVLLGAAIAIAGIAARWRDSRPAERLLALWILIGLLELVVHDAGNERRYVMLLPAIVALAAGLAGTASAWLPAQIAQAPMGARLLSVPLVALLGYLVSGSALRWVFQNQILNGQFKVTVRLSAALAAAFAVMLVVFWPRATAWIARRRVSLRAAIVLTTLAVAWNLGQFAGWAALHRDLNYRASIALGQMLPPGTLVHGKLANGLALDNFIKPVFVGKGFGNYADRLSRDDARYILTYGLPELGRESFDGLIREILDHYPNWRRVAVFDVDETPEPDQAWLIDKLSGAASVGSVRAPD